MSSETVQLAALIMWTLAGIMLGFAYVMSAATRGDSENAHRLTFAAMTLVVLAMLTLGFSSTLD